MKTSTGLRDYKNITGSVKAALDGGIIKIYGAVASEAAALAAIPDSADDAFDSNGAVLLCTVSNASFGTGINFGTTSSSGVLSKAAAETWSGDYTATGYPSFARFQSLSDAGGSSTTEKRIQLTVGILNKEITISSALKTLGDEQRLDSFFVGEPEGT